MNFSPPYVPRTRERGSNKPGQNETRCADFAREFRCTPFLHAGCRRFESVTAHNRKIKSLIIISILATAASPCLKVRP
jgi:hypothetical protein